MTTSGSYDFALSTRDIIKDALEICGVMPFGATLDSGHYASCFRSLNLIVKNLQTDGIRLWTIEEKTKTFTASSEVTGTDGLIYTCIKSHTSAASNKPVTGADYTTYWAQTGDTGGSWVTSTAYTNIGEFTVDADCLQIDSAFIRDTTNSDSLPLKIISYSDYMNIENKDDTGTPTRLVFDRQLLPRVILYPLPDDTTDVLHYLQIRKLEDYDDGENTSDFPVSWERALVWLLADDISIKFGLSIERLAFIKNKAREIYLQAKSSDREITDSEFTQGAY